MATISMTIDIRGGAVREFVRMRMGRYSVLQRNNVDGSEPRITASGKRFQKIP